MEQLYVYFEVTKSTGGSRTLQDCNLEGGFTLDASAVHSTTVFGLSGGCMGTTAMVPTFNPTCIMLTAPKGCYKLLSAYDGGVTVEIDDDVQLIISDARLAATLSGTQAVTPSGEGRVLLSHLVCQQSNSCNSVCVPVAYTSNCGISTAMFCIVNTRITLKNAESNNINIGRVNFKKTEKSWEALVNCQRMMERYLNEASTLRQQDEFLCERAPKLTLSVVPHGSVAMQRPNVEPSGSGINGTGFSFLPALMMSNLYPTSKKRQELNAMLGTCIFAALDFDMSLIGAFLNDTKQPGVTAAKHCPVVAAVASLMMGYSMQYAPDGFVTHDGIKNTFVHCDQWSTSAGDYEAGDCDNVGIRIASTLRGVRNMHRDECADLAWVKAVKNVLNPYYMVCLAIVATTSPEATGDLNCGKGLQGHCCVDLVNTFALLEMLEKGDKNRQHPVHNAEDLAEARFKAVFGCFNGDYKRDPKQWERFRGIWPVDDLDSSELSKLGCWRDACAWWCACCGTAFSPLEEHRVLTVEGTSPSIPFIGLPRACGRKLETRVPAGLRPYCCLGDWVQLHVELSLGTDGNPFFEDEQVQQLGGCFTQLVLTSMHGLTSGKLKGAGASPHELTGGKNAAVPLYIIPPDEQLVYAYGCKKALEHEQQPSNKIMFDWQRECTDAMVQKIEAMVSDTGLLFEQFDATDLEHVTNHKPSEHDVQSTIKDLLRSEKRVMIILPPAVSKYAKSQASEIVEFMSTLANDKKLKWTLHRTSIEGLLETPTTERPDAYDFLHCLVGRA